MDDQNILVAHYSTNYMFIHLARIRINDHTYVIYAQ